MSDKLFCSECGDEILFTPLVVQAKRGSKTAQAILCSVTCAQMMLDRVFIQGEKKPPRRKTERDA